LGANDVILKHTKFQVAEAAITVIYADSWKVHRQVLGWRKDNLIRTSAVMVGPWNIKREIRGKTDFEYQLW
jgi:hypothetical protein